MKRLITIILLTVFLISGAAATEVQMPSSTPSSEKKIVFIYSDDYKSFVRKGIDIYWQKGIDNFLYKQSTKIKTFFLNANTKQSDENAFIASTNAIAERIEEFKPDYIITMGDEAFYLYEKFLTSYPTLVSCISNLNEDAVKRAKELTPFVTTHDIGLNKFFSYIHKNGAATPHFYILRDVTAKSYRVYNKLREILYKKNQFFKIHNLEVTSMQDLRNQMANLYNEERGVIIPLFTSLPDFDSNKIIGWEGIIKFIVDNNFRSIELILEDDGSDLGAAISATANHKPCMRPTIKETNYINYFLMNPKKAMFYSEQSALIVKKSRIIQLHANELLKDVSDIECLE